jgi:hypothetical protein
MAAEATPPKETPSEETPRTDANPHEEKSPAAQGLTQAPGESVSALTGSQHGNSTGVRAVPEGLPAGVRIRTAADVLPFAVAALGNSGASALIALLNSNSYLANNAVGVNNGHTEYPYQYPPLNAVLDRAPAASFASGATALGAALTVLAAPITLAALSALLFVESIWLHTPLTTSWAVAALIMSASTLLPVGPLDGAQLGKAGVLAAAGVLGGALLVGLGLI